MWWDMLTVSIFPFYIKATWLTEVNLGSTRAIESRSRLSMSQGGSDTLSSSINININSCWCCFVYTLQTLWKRLIWVYCLDRLVFIIICPHPPMFLIAVIWCIHSTPFKIQGDDLCRFCCTSIKDVLVS